MRAGRFPPAAHGREEGTFPFPLTQRLRAELWAKRAAEPYREEGLPLGWERGGQTLSCTQRGRKGERTLNHLVQILTLSSISHMTIDKSLKLIFSREKQQ